MKIQCLMVTTCLALAAASASSAQETGGSSEEDTRLLDEITTTADKVASANIPQTGELFIRPVLYTQGRSQNSPVRQVDLFFAPVEAIDNGAAQVFDDERRYRVSLNVPVMTTTGTRFQLAKGNKIDLGTEIIDMPEGTYVLSEIRYSYNSRTGAGGALLFDEDLSTRAYCLTEETYVFNVFNGSKQFLGALALAPFPKNSARLSSFHPVVGLDQRLEMLDEDSDEIVEDMNLAPFNLIPIEAGRVRCADGADQTSALAPT